MAIVTLVDTSSGPVAFNGPVALNVALPSTQTKYFNTSLGLIFSGTVATSITFAIGGLNPDAFVATLKTQLVSGGRPGGTFPPTEVSTGPGGSAVSAVLQPPERGENFSYSFEITFTAPSTAPQFLTGTLVVTWLDGGLKQTQSVTLNGTVSEITASVKFGFFQLGFFNYDVTINYVSFDPSPLNVEITNPHPLPGFTVKNQPVIAQLDAEVRGEVTKILVGFPSKINTWCSASGARRESGGTTVLQVSSPNFPLFPPILLTIGVSI